MKRERHVGVNTAQEFERTIVKESVPFYDNFPKRFQIRDLTRERERERCTRRVILFRIKRIFQTKQRLSRNDIATDDVFLFFFLLFHNVPRFVTHNLSC